MESLGLWLPVGSNCTNLTSIVPLALFCLVYLLLEKLGQKAGWRPGNKAFVLYEVLRGASIAVVEFGTNCCH